MSLTNFRFYKFPIFLAPFSNVLIKGYEKLLCINTYTKFDLEQSHNIKIPVPESLFE